MIFWKFFFSYSVSAVSLLLLIFSFLIFFLLSHLRSDWPFRSTNFQTIACAQPWSFWHQSTVFRRGAARSVRNNSCGQSIFRWKYSLRVGQHLQSTLCINLSPSSSAFRLFWCINWTFGRQRPSFLRYPNRLCACNCGKWTYWTWRVRLRFYNTLTDQIINAKFKFL